ncbi:apolipoprotein N-acyltransferase [Spirabiliibacterium falconis]|uniref:apolipoprotein N-acyltransferase n=1 Tax=Spirabiliibacterium falconis TaxID=572023 RepID=UPI001AACFC8A|nr:apolipoprotein N-acyltransferase [Spirabiliibacterium falconis]MBE2894784.1 apolipoprotein N-acyltransferase [Spirabiliibacterium falconis]
MRFAFLFYLLSATALGVLGVLAFSPFDYWLVAFISTLGLLYFATHSQRKTALWGSYFWGLGFFAFGINWIHVSINLFGGVPLIFSFLAVGVLAAYLALYPLLFAYILQRFQIKSAVAMAIVWTITEFLRGWVMTGFPWLQLGYSQIDSPFSGIAPLLGVQGVTFFIVFACGQLLTLCKPDRTLPISVRITALLSLAVVSGGVLLLHNANFQGQKTQRATAQTITLVQGNIEQNRKWDPAYAEKTLAIYQALIQPHLGKSDVIILPEAAIPVVENRVQRLLLSWQQAALEKGSELIVGTVYADHAQQRFYNSIITLGNPTALYQQAESAVRYNKHHLVPFGEYVPLESMLRPLGTMFDLPMSNFTQGDFLQNALKTQKSTMTAAICYEIVLGSQLQQNLAHNKSEYILTISNDAWFGDTIGPWQHLQMARMRALENGKTVIRATNNGITAFINAHGKITAQAPQFQATTLTATLENENIITPYSQFGDKLLYGLLLILALFNITSYGLRYKIQQIAQREKQKS